MAVGVLFKVGAVPFHSWIPDVYQGAPTPITAFMAAATKIAAFGAMLRIFYVALPDLRADWRPVMWVIAILTMVVGTVTAVTQTDVKRMLAYSAVAHAGFHPDRCHRRSPTAACPARCSTCSPTASPRWARSRWSAWCVTPPAKRTPTWRTGQAWVAAIPLSAVVFSMFLLAFAGIPLTSGFVAKFAVFKAAGEGGAIPLVIVGVIASAIAAYFYVRVIVLMFFTDPPADAPEVVRPSWTEHRDGDADGGCHAGPRRATAAAAGPGQQLGAVRALERLRLPEAVWSS